MRGRRVLSGADRANHLDTVARLIFLRRIGIDPYRLYGHELPARGRSTALPFRRPSQTSLCCDAGKATEKDGSRAFVCDAGKPAGFRQELSRRACKATPLVAIASAWSTILATSSEPQRRFIEPAGSFWSPLEGIV